MAWSGIVLVVQGFLYFGTTSVVYQGERN